MAAIPWVGPPPTDPTHLAIRGYISELLSTSLSQSAVNALLASGFAPYVTKAYVDAQDNLLANKAFIDNADATRLKLSQKGLNNGVLGLNSTGRVDIARIDADSTQRYPKPYISPAAYNGATVSATTTEVQVYQVSVANPGFTYKLMVFGSADGITSVDGQYPILRVRQGATNGPVIAQGMGLAETYGPGGSGSGPTYSTPGSHVHTIPTTVTTFDIIAIGGGGSGGGAYGSNVYSTGGGPGAWVAVRGIRGTNVSTSETQFTATIPAAAVGGLGGFSAQYGVAGGAVQVSAPSLGTFLTAGGGAGGNAYQFTYSPGGTPSAYVFNGTTYTGGTGGGSSGAAGVAPGGGGAGNNAGGPGGNGGAGGVWFVPIVGVGEGDTTVKGSVPILPRALNAQTALNGATTLYVMLARSGSSGTASVTTLRPKLHVTAVPA